MNTFEELGLSHELLKAVKNIGFVNPTPIQEKIIPAILNSEKDLVGLAQTGTGKTAGFGLPIQQQIDFLSKNVQALVLSPTRELCIQITKDLESYAKYIPDLKHTAIYGGADITKQLKALKNNPQIVVGTPGRVLDLINRKALKVNAIRWLVLDEADEMLNMGFKEELDKILVTTPQAKRTFLFSATMPKEVQRIAENYMNVSEEISIGKRNSGADNVKHLFYMVQAKDRYEALKRMADINPDIYGIVFCRTRRETKEVAEKLKNDGYNADALHGDLSQAQRDYVMNGFRKKHLQMLVATDVAARGLDVNDLTHIINYKLPDELGIYLHRSGRTGRAGKSGISISIIHTREINKIKSLEKLINKKFTKSKIPSGRDICEKQLFNLIDRMENIEVDEMLIENYMEVIYKKLEWLSREDLIKRFVSVEFNRFLNYYKNAPDLTVSESKQKREDKEIKRPVSFTRFFINVGSTNNLTPPRMIGLINDYTKRRNIGIGKIDILKNFSFFEVDKKFENDILNGFKNATFHGIKITSEISKPDPQKSRKQDSFRGEFKKKKKKKRY
ncbi:MAG: DEAD/DEAH box helicase [Bacteroidetes bacterium]|nr:DEAD/DEAH box helicase [Bacteroidota bacterium]MBL7104931.1 DEAD/DEAH box helicase [Bacteroidales bacterium]